MPGHHTKGWTRVLDARALLQRMESTVGNNTTAATRQTYIDKLEADRKGTTTTISSATDKKDTTETRFEGEKYIPTESTTVLPQRQGQRYNPARTFLAEKQSFMDQGVPRWRTAAAATELMARVDNANEFGKQIVEISDKVALLEQGAGRFVAKPQAAIREPRPTWEHLQFALRNRIIPNELYEDKKGEGEYELTTYNITLFMLEEGRLFNKRLNELSQDIKTIDHVKAMGGIILAQTAGTDEFYIEDLNYTTTIGGLSTLTTAIRFNIVSPYQADFPDHLFRAADKLKIRNYQDLPLHMLIEWRGRDAKTSKATKPTTFTSRCYAVYFANMNLSVDERGGIYSVEAYRASERGLGQDKVYLKKDITISGKTVGGVLGELVGRLQNATAKEERNVWVPDKYIIEIPAEWRDWEVRSPYEIDFSNLSSNTNHGIDIIKSVSDATSGSQVNVVEMPNAATSFAVDTFSSQKHLNESKMVRTFTFKSGTDIITVIQSVLNAAAKFQQLIVNDEYDLQAANAQVKRTKPESIWKWFAKIDVDVEYIGFDKNTRQYACKRVYQVIKHLDPLLGINEETTQQTKEVSYTRLYTMLENGIIEKAYPYYYTGLNTEIKSLDLKFDNHYIIARSMSSNKGGMQKRQHGVYADKDTGIAAGSTDEKYNSLHDKYKQEIGAIEGDIVALDAATMPAMLSNSIEVNKRLAAVKKVKQAQLAGLKQYENITQAQLDAVIAGKLELHLEGVYTDDAGKLIMDAGRYYFTERVQKIMPPGLYYISDFERKSDDGVLFPVKFGNANTPKAKTGTNDDGHNAMNLVAQEIAQRKSASLVQIDLEIRGDPYWLPETISGINLDSISPAHQQPMLIIIASQGSDYNNAGLFQVNERNSISAVYNVITIDHIFSGGEFTQMLKCARDPQVDINAVLRAPDKFIKYNEHVELTGGDFSDGAGWE